MNINTDSPLRATWYASLDASATSSRVIVWYASWDVDDTARDAWFHLRHEP